MAANDNAHYAVLAAFLQAALLQGTLSALVWYAIFGSLILP